MTTARSCWTRLPSGQPPADQNFLQFLTRIDGQGGCAVVETDNVAGWRRHRSVRYWLDYDIAPVMDVGDGVALLAKAPSSASPSD